MASFSGPNGQHPFTSLTLSGSTLYGTTAGGGAGYNPRAGNYGNGTVFSVPSTGGTPTVLASFNGSNGQYPYAGVTLSGNTLYGTTPYGGTDSEGNIFSVPITGGTPTVLVSFTSNSHSSGQWPFAGLILSGNALYGTTFVGGANGDGTVFALTPNAIISLTATAPAAFGVQVGTLAVVGGNGKYKVATATFPATPTGYVAVSGFNPASDTENYALHITNSVGANLAADLADAASEINAFTYTGYSLTASTIDPTGGSFGSGYNFFLTVTGSTLGSSPYLGFDFTQAQRHYRHAERQQCRGARTGLREFAPIGRCGDLQASEPKIGLRSKRLRRGRWPGPLSCHSAVGRIKARGGSGSPTAFTGDRYHG